MKNKILTLYPLNTDLANLLLRLMFGGLFFIHHGAMKLFSFSKILPMFHDVIGIGPKLSLILVVFAEFFCGILVAAGFLTRLAVIPIFIDMTVAFYIAHAHDNFQVKELAFIFWVLSIVIFIMGSGKYSVDNIIFKRKEV